MFVDLNEYKYNKNFSFNLVLSRPNESWKGDTGYIQDSLTSCLKKIKNPLIYACGNPLMIEEVRNISNKLGIVDFMSDAFVES